MADIYMHSRLAEEVIKHLDDTLDEKLVFLGAQGPDPLYYNPMAKDGSEYRFYADRMHDTNTQMLLSNMTTYVKTHFDQKAYAYLIGFLCHYALDVKLHPYVYYNVGVYKKDDPNTHQYRGLHLKFERSIDVALIQRETNNPARKMKLHKRYFPSRLAPHEVMKLYDYTLKQTYGKSQGGVMISIGTKKMYGNVKHLVSDRFGLKKALLKTLDLFNKDTDMFYQDVSFFNHLEHYDFLNEQHQEWHHPITNEPSTKSVADLFEEAKTFALSLIKGVKPYILDQKTVDLNAIFTNLSFNSGMNCDYHDKMTYFKIYRKN